MPEVATNRKRLGELKHFVPRGQVVYTVLRKRSTSGVSRTISVVTVKNGILVDITSLAAEALGYKLQGTSCATQFKVDGCGLDVGYEVVTRLSSYLYGAPNQLEHRWV